MALYQIIRTPGKTVEWPRAERPDPKHEGKTLPADPPLKNQDEAKVILQRLRLAAKKQDLKCDFIIQPIKDAKATNGSSAGQATSIRLTEEVRKQLARFVGRVMMETGNQISMGDGLLYLIAHYNKTADQFEIPSVLPGQEDLELETA